MRNPRPAWRLWTSNPRCAVRRASAHGTNLRADTEHHVDASRRRRRLQNTSSGALPRWRRPPGALCCSQLVTSSMCSRKTLRCHMFCPVAAQRPRGARAECDAHVERQLSARQPRAADQRRGVVGGRGRPEGEAATVRGAPPVALPDEAGSAAVRSLLRSRSSSDTRIPHD